MLLSILLFVAQTSQPPAKIASGGQARNQAQSYDAQTEELRAIRGELAAIKEQQAKGAKDRAEAQPYQGPPIYSNWVLAIIAAVGAIATWRAFTHGRDAVRLTQRADVLLMSAAVDPIPLSGESKVLLIIKNFGPTRASELAIKCWIGQERPERFDPIPAITLASGDTQRIPFNELRQHFQREEGTSILRGDIPLWFSLELSYRDVFGKPHTLTCSGQHMNRDSHGFAIMSHQST